MAERAKLILEDGTCFFGKSFGYEKSVSGEIVFNTGMVGYPESITDPSYTGQILTFTYPLIGNYGVPSCVREGSLSVNFESEKIHIQAIIVSDYCERYSHRSAERSLSQWLLESKIPAISDIDTRRLTTILRESGTMPGKIIFGEEDVAFYDPDRENLVGKVSSARKKTYGSGHLKILVVDCGVKAGILRSLLAYDVTLTLVPYDYDFSRDDYDALVISNGPGNPKMCAKTVANVRKALLEDRPVLGICLGHQIISLAAGAETYKLKYGHRSQNQPSIEVGTKKCYITSQNHGFAVDEKTLPDEWQPWFTNANDGSNEGIRHRTKPFFSVQFHPEASPGPADTGFLFSRFISSIRSQGEG